MQSDIVKSTLSDLKRGIITPELAMETLAPSPFIRMGSLSVEDLKVVTIPSGFSTLDRNFFLKKNRPEVITVAAPTSHGKSAFLMQLAKNVSLQGPVFVINLEMSSKALTTRLLASETGCSITSIMSGSADLEKLKQKSAELLAKRQLYVTIETGSDIGSIQRICFEQAKRIGKPLLIVVDHVQLVSSSVDKDTKAYMYGHVMEKLRYLAVQLNCPLITATQLNRENEKRGRSSKKENGYGDYRPALADIADSSGIVNNSDIMLFIVRPEQYEGTRKGEANFYCYKNKEGPCFEFTMRWNGMTTSFYEYSSPRIGL